MAIFGRKKELAPSPMAMAVDRFRGGMPPMSTIMRGGGEGGGDLQKYLSQNEDFVKWAARNGLGTHAVEMRIGAQYFTGLANTVLEQMRLGGNMVQVLSGANRQIYDICNQKDPVKMADKALGLCESIANRYHSLSGERPNFLERMGVSVRRHEEDSWDRLVGFGIIQPWMGLIENIAQNAPAIRQDIKNSSKEEITQAANYIRLKDTIRAIRQEIEKSEQQGNQIRAGVDTKVIPMERDVNRADFQAMRKKLTGVMQEVITSVAERGDVGKHCEALKRIVAEMENVPEASVKEMRRCVELGLQAAKVYLVGIGVETADAVYEAAAMHRFTTIVNASNLSMLGVLGLAQSITSAAIMNTQITTAMLGEMSITVSASKFNPREVVKTVIDRWQAQNEAVRKQSELVSTRPDMLDMGEVAKQIGKNEELLTRR